jgi:DNA-directed RNA polymerase subunit RPC12/RpoP
MGHQRYLTVFALASILLAAANLHAQQPVKEFYQDFRNKKPFDELFRLQGLHIATEAKQENEGLRFTLPAERGNHVLDEVIANFQVEGDFEYTATYEMLSAVRPKKGYGVGVNLTIASAAEPVKYGKFCRVVRAKEGHVYMSETWPKYKIVNKPTEVMSGQLRLTRIGPTLYYLASEGAGKEFQEIWKVADYGTEPLKYLGFQVTDSAEPGNPVDARLIDLRVRMGKLDLAKMTDASPVAEPVPAMVEKKDQPIAQSGTSWIWIIGIVGGAILLLLLFAIVVIAVLLVRRKAAAKKQTVDKTDRPPSSALMVFACERCGKKLKVKTDAAGKKIKCPKCGDLIVAPVAS